MRRRVFTVGEANALLPHMREVLGRILELREAVGERTDQLKILDVIWGRKVAEKDNPDHETFRTHRKAIGGAVEEIERLIREEILALGVRFPPGGLPSGGVGARPPGFSHHPRREAGLSLLACGGTGDRGLARGGWRVSGPETSDPQSGGPHGRTGLRRRLRRTRVGPLRG
jgi:hypothetical protein